MALPPPRVAAVGTGVGLAAAAVVTTPGELARLVALAHDRTDHLSASTSLRDLYAAAVTVAQTEIGGDLGDAIAGLFAMEIERLRLIRWNSVLGQSKVLLSLALAVLARRGRSESGT